MQTDATFGLLPSGMADTLMPTAARERQAVTDILDACSRHGFAQVAPPLLEFEETLFSGAGNATRQRAFRVLDPEANRMAAIRADMTAQVARIAATRLAHAPRPLRLCYAGPVLSSQSRIHRKKRQRLQAGMEIFGTDSPYADLEVITIAITTLKAMGLATLTLDLNLPGLAESLLAPYQLAAPEHAAMLQALALKDRTALAALPDADLLQALVSLAGPVTTALPALRALKLPAEATRMAERLEELVRLLQTGFPELDITLDPLESRGFEYHNTVSFSLLCPATDQELGRGGRFLHQQEHATGLTLYVDTLAALLPTQKARPILSIPANCPAQTLAHWQAEGYVTLRNLTLDDDVTAAQKQGCTHRLDGDRAIPLNTQHDLSRRN